MSSSTFQQVVVLQRLGKLRSQYPELRLAQLIGNVFHHRLGLDPYYMEDEEFIQRLEEYYAS
jgi:hypothetical protein